LNKFEEGVPKTSHEGETDTQTLLFCAFLFFIFSKSSPKLYTLSLSAYNLFELSYPFYIFFFVVFPYINYLGSK